MGSKAKVMVNVLGNAQDHASVLIGHADVLIRGNASIMEDIVNIGIIIGITIGNAPDPGNAIIGVKTSIMMSGTSIGKSLDGNVHLEKIAVIIVVNIVSKKNQENDLDINLTFTHSVSKFRFLFKNYKILKSLKIGQFLFMCQN